MKKLLAILLVLLLLCSCKTLPETSEPENTQEEIPEEEPFRSVVVAPEYFYEFRRDVVKYSSINPESDFAKSAVEFVKAFLEKTFSENKEIESFKITDVEADINTTNWNVNAYSYPSDIKNKDLLNNFLVVRFRCIVNPKGDLKSPIEGLDHDYNEPLEGHLWLIYDPDDKYDFLKTEIPEQGWKVWNKNFWEWNDDIHTEEEMFDVFYARKNENLPIYTNLEEDDELSLLAAEYARTNLENSLKNDPNILTYQILDIKANINHTNWYINTLQYPDYTVNTLENNIVCISYRWMEDLKISERNLYLLYDCGEWITLDASPYPFDAFDDLTEEDLIGDISSLSK